MKKRMAAWAVLLVITVVAAFCLSLTNENTKGIIAKQEDEKAEQARKTLLPEAETFEQQTLNEDSGLASLYAGKKGDETIGYVALVTAKGFGGPVEVTVGADMNAVITGITVGGSQFSETAGLGAKSKDAAFTDQFNDRVTPLKVIKAGGTKADNTVDAITAATITSTAVTGAVNDAGNYIKDVLGLNKEDEPAAGAKTATASAKGFGGPVAVTITLDDKGVIGEITIGDENFAETEGFGAKALEDSFKAQFIGMTPPVAIEQIDAISGATYTSTAVVNAINKAYDKIQESAANAGRTAKASKKGFGGPVAVTITLDDNNAISDITIGDENFAETEGFGAKALEDSFKAQFIGMAPPLTQDKIDAISGATYTSTAVVEAINAAYEKIMNPAEASAPAATQAPAQTEAPAASSDVSGNVVTASKKGFGGPVSVKLTVGDNNTIKALTIGDENFAESAGFGARALEPSFAEQFVGKSLPVALSDIDALTGATITSQAVVDAVNKAFDKYQAAAPAATEAPAASVPSEAPAASDVAASSEAPAQTEAAASYTASRQGYAGPVSVTLTVAQDGTIAALVIGGDGFAETTGFGARALESSFAAQFVGKKLPVFLSDIDAISGATTTSKAVVEAVNDAYAQYLAANAK